MAGIDLIHRKAKTLRNNKLSPDEKAEAILQAEKELLPTIEESLEILDSARVRKDNVFDLSHEELDVIESRELMTDKDFEDFLSGRLYDEEPGGQGHTKTSTSKDTEERLNNILKRISLEEGFEKLDSDQVASVRELVQVLGPRIFDDVRMSILSDMTKKGKLPDADGRYHFLQKVIEINKLAAEGEFDTTMVHELWHHVSTYLPDDYRAKLEKEFLKKQEKFLNSSATATQAEINKFKNLDEYFAVTMSDMWFADIDLKYNDLAPKGTLKRVAQEMLLLIRDTFRALGQKMGFGVSRKIYNNFMDRQFGVGEGVAWNPVKVRDTPLRKLEGVELDSARSHYEMLGYPPEEIDKLLLREAYSDMPIEWGARDVDPQGEIVGDMKSRHALAGLFVDIKESVEMTPSQFHALNPPHSGEPYSFESTPRGTVEWLQELDADPKQVHNVAPPFVMVRWQEKSQAWEVIGHEGRHRAQAYKDLVGDGPMVVDVYRVEGGDNRPLSFDELSDAQKAAGFLPETGEGNFMDWAPKPGETLTSDEGLAARAQEIEASGIISDISLINNRISPERELEINKAANARGPSSDMPANEYVIWGTPTPENAKEFGVGTHEQPLYTKAKSREEAEKLIEHFTEKGMGTGFRIQEIDFKETPFSDPESLLSSDLPSFKNSVPGGSKEPTVTSVFSLFSGGDTFGSALALLAQKFAGIRASIRGVEIHTLVEWDKRALEIGNMQAGTNFSRGDVHKIDPQDLIDAVAANPYGLLFHASPVCKSFSKANRAKTIKPEDLKSAKKVAELIRKGRPPMFTLENVIDYKHDKNGKKLYKLITDALDDEGYSYKDFEVNAADFGSAQDRKRLILLATRDDMQDITTIIPELGVPDPASKGDWHELLHNDIYNPDPASFIDETEWLSTGGKGGGVPDELVRVKKMLKSTSDLQPDLPIFLMGGAGQGSAAAYNPGRPTTALTTNRQIARVLIPDKSKPQGYRAMRATPQMMRKLMGLPEGYKLPEMHEGMTLREKKAITSQSKLVLGNGIHGAITENFLFPLSMAVRKDVYEARVRAEKNLQGLFGEWGTSKSPELSSDMPRDGRLDAEEILKEYEAAVKAGDNLKKNQLIEAWGMRYGIDPDTALGIKKDGPYSDMPSSTQQPDEALGFQLRPGSKLTPYNRQVMSFLDNIIVDQSTTRGEAQGLLDILEDAAEHGDIDPEKIAGVINTATLSDQSQRMFKHLFESLGQRVNNRVDHLGNRIDPEGPDFDARNAEEAAVEYLAKMQGTTPGEVARLLRKSSALVGEQSKSAQAALLYIDHHLDMVLELGEAASTGNAELLQRLGFEDQQQAMVAFARAYDQAGDLLTSYGAYRRETGRALRSFQSTAPRIMEGARASKIIDEMGGNQRLISLYKRLKASRKIAGKNNMMAVSELERYSKKYRVHALLNEHFVNFVLSSIKTLSTNTLGNAMITLYGPLEVLMGARVRKVGKWFKGESLDDVNFQIDQATREFTELFHQFSEALGWWKKAWDNKDYILDPGHDLLDIPDSMKDAWTAENVGQVIGKELDPEKGLGRAIEWWGNTLRLPSRFLMATDEFFKQWNYRATVAADLHMKGRKLLEDGFIDNIDTWVEQEMSVMTRRGQAFVLDRIEDEARKRFDASDPKYNSREGADQLLKDQSEWVAQQMGDPSIVNRGEVADRALQIARERTFTTDLDPDNGIMSRLGKTLQEFSYHHPLMRILVPFIRTPLNIFLYASRRAALPMVNKDLHRAADYLWKTKFGKEYPRLEGSKNEIAQIFSGGDERAKAEALGRMTAAIGMSSLFFGGAAAGLITGGGPNDHNQRKLMTQAGWQPYSIKIGDKYVSYQKLDPIATVVSIFADIQEVLRYAPPELQGNIENLMVGIVSTFFENMQNKSYLQGIQNIVSVLDDPERSVGRVGGSLAAAFAVPNIVASARAVTDDNMMEVRSMLDQIISKIPILNQNVLEPQRNVLGEVVTKKTFDGGMKRIGGVGEMLLPVTINATTNDEVAQHLAELGYPLSLPLRRRYGLDLTEHLNAKGQSAYDRWLELSGTLKLGKNNLPQALRRLINMKLYKALPEDGLYEYGEESPRIKEIQKLIGRYRSAAERVMLEEFPDVKKQAEQRIIGRWGMEKGMLPEEVRSKLFQTEK